MVEIVVGVIVIAMIFGIMLLFEYMNIDMEFVFIIVFLIPIAWFIGKITMEVIKTFC